MDTLTLNTFLSPILSVTSVWNTGETGDINVVPVCTREMNVCVYLQKKLKEVLRLGPTLKKIPQNQTRIFSPLKWSQSVLFSWKRDFPNMHQFVSDTFFEKTSKIREHCLLVICNYSVFDKTPRHLKIHTRHMHFYFCSIAIKL